MRSGGAVAGPTIGLALSSGGARGSAHIGALRVLEQNGIVPDVIAGTSMGAYVGGAYACGVSLDVLEDEWRSTSVLRTVRDDAPDRPVVGLDVGGRSRAGAAPHVRPEDVPRARAAVRRADDGPRVGAAVCRHRRQSRRRRAGQPLGAGPVHARLAQRSPADRRRRLESSPGRRRAADGRRRGHRRGRARRSLRGPNVRACPTSARRIAASASRRARARTSRAPASTTRACSPSCSRCRPCSSAGFATSRSRRRRPTSACARTSPPTPRATAESAAGSRPAPPRRGARCRTSGARSRRPARR